MKGNCTLSYYLIAQLSTTNANASQLWLQECMPQRYLFTLWKDHGSLNDILLAICQTILLSLNAREVSISATPFSVISRTLAKSCKNHRSGFWPEELGLTGTYVRSESGEVTVRHTSDPPYLLCERQLMFPDTLTFDLCIWNSTELLPSHWPITTKFWWWPDWTRHYNPAYKVEN